MAVRGGHLSRHAPELQPVAREWPLVHEAVAERCRVLAQDPETLRRHSLFHWWPRTKELA